MMFAALRAPGREQPPAHPVVDRIGHAVRAVIARAAMMLAAPQAPGREHIPAYPVVYRIVRAATVPATIIVLGLDGYGLSVVSVSGGALTMFTCVASLVTAGYFFVAYYFVAAGFNCWALLGLDAFGVFFWLVSFALLASQAARWHSYGLYGTGLTVAQCYLAAAGIGALCFLLYAAALVLDGLVLYRHRAAGYRCRPGAADFEKTDAPAPSMTPMTAMTMTPAPIIQPADLPPHHDAPIPYVLAPHHDAPIPYYDEQLAHQPQPPPSPFFGTPPPSVPTPVSYVQSPADSHASLYYAQQPPHEVPQPPQPPQQAQASPQQYYEVAAEPIHYEVAAEPVQPQHKQ